jgi:hypothetical protein
MNVAIRLAFLFLCHFIMDEIQVTKKYPIKKEVGIMGWNPH